MSATLTANRYKTEHRVAIVTVAGAGGAASASRMSAGPRKSWLSTVFTLSPWTWTGMPPRRQLSQARTRPRQLASGQMSPISPERERSWRMLEKFGRIDALVNNAGLRIAILSWSSVKSRSTARYPYI